MTLGAAQVWDYNSPSGIADITAALSAKITAGALAIGANSAEACMSILPNCPGTKFIAMATFPYAPTRARFPVLTMAYNFLTWNILTTLKAWRHDINCKLFTGTALIHHESELSLGSASYEAFLPDALAKRKYVPALEPLAVGHGLEALEAAMDQQRNGVSARKIVVKL